MQEVKDRVVSHIEAEAEQWLGSAMTYTLFQSVQEYYVDLVSMQPDSIADINSHASKLKITEESQQVSQYEFTIKWCYKLSQVKLYLTLLRPRKR